MDWFAPAAGEAELTGTVSRVSDVSRLIATLLDDPRLQDIWIEGEVRDLRRPPKGHLYFSLSERKAGITYTINCAMWRTFARELAFAPSDGMHVIAWGSVEVYEPHGKYQVIVRDLRPAGAGEKHLLVEQWKEMLTREGLFDTARKRPLPRFPKTVGVVTSASGAARHDIEQVIARRFPVAILLSPATVQGENAPREIASALRRLDGRADVIIVGRGGGSFEELFAFNHPDVVRAVAACTTPVVSAVGHETDTTLCDFAADVRAPTPSAAAELVVPDRRELQTELNHIRGQMQAGWAKKADHAGHLLEDIRLRIAPRRFRRRINTELQSLAETAERLERAIRNRTERERLVLGHLRAKIEANSPFGPLKRGYALVTKSGAPVVSACELLPGDEVRIRMADGTAGARILEVDHDR
ncbi:MAG: exodeoxyribonuclease VII large subunit [Methanomicrobiales archaeon]|nr:exodeoxyribonuclease VII large subunit [Methanomicrobiales archaeon]